MGNTIHLYNNPNLASLEHVVNVDGVFMAIRKVVFNTSRFNQELLHPGFIYMISICHFKSSKYWKVAVIFNIDILHFTEGGNFGNEWVEYTLKWHEIFFK